MEIYLLNADLKRFMAVRKYSSLTWNTFFNSVGNFTLEVALDLVAGINLGSIQENDIFVENTDDPNNVGVIEAVDKTTDENGEKTLLLKGRMSSTLLDRRVSLYTNEFQDKNPAYCVDSFMQTNVLDPKDVNRKISIIAYDKSVQPAELSGIKIDYELKRGVDGLQFIQDICVLADIGFSFGINESEKFELMLYKGKDRTVDQDANGIILIEQRKGTAFNLGYYKDTTLLKTWSTIDKENGVITSHPISSADGKSGLKRREMFLDLSSISQTITKEDGTQVVIADNYYNNMIQNEAKTRMSEQVVTEYMDAEIQRDIARRFRKDFYLGDTVTINDNELGLSYDAPITGATEVYSSDKGYELSLQIGKNLSQVVYSSVVKWNNAAKSAKG